MTKRTKLEGLQPRRKRAGMTQAEVAETLGVERATVGMWETGTSWPSARVLPDLAGLLCCSIDELYEAPEETEGRIATPVCGLVRNDKTAPEEGSA